MFKIEDLLDLFENEKVKALLLRSYNESQKSNKQLSDSVFMKLYNLKLFNKGISIIINFNLPTSYFDPGTRNNIYLNTLSPTTFLHELTHLLSFHHSHYKIPDEYMILKESISKDSKKRLITSRLINICNSKLFYLFLINHLDPSKPVEFDNGKENQFKVLQAIEDILDALYDGHLTEEGYNSYIKDNNYMTEKNKRSWCGHRSGYYNDSSHQFEEILADYQVINMLDPNNQLFLFLKESILGNEFTSFLDQRCKDINKAFEINKQPEDEIKKK